MADAIHAVSGQLLHAEPPEPERWLLRCDGCGWFAFTATDNPDEADPLINAHLIDVGGIDPSYAADAVDEVERLNRRLEAEFDNLDLNDELDAAEPFGWEDGDTFTMPIVVGDAKPGDPLTIEYEDGTTEVVPIGKTDPGLGIDWAKLAADAANLDLSDDADDLAVWPDPEWELATGVTCVVCEECAFTFDAVHTDGDTDGYTCPVCAEARLETEVEMWRERVLLAEADVAQLRDERADADAEIECLTGSLEGTHNALKVIDKLAAGRGTALDQAVAEVERMREHSITLNRIGWRLAEAVGEVEADAEVIEANPDDLLARLLDQQTQAVERLHQTIARQAERILDLMHPKDAPAESRFELCRRLQAAEAEVSQLRGELTTASPEYVRRTFGTPAPWAAGECRPNGDYDPPPGGERHAQRVARRIEAARETVRKVNDSCRPNGDYDDEETVGGC